MLLAVPVKPLNETAPYLSWKQPASKPLVEESVSKLPKYFKDRKETVLIVHFGCGVGGLLKDEVVPILRKYLVEDKFVLVSIGS